MIGPSFVSDGRGPGIWNVGLATLGLETSGGEEVEGVLAGAEGGAEVGATGADVAGGGVMLSAAAGRWAPACVPDW